MAQPPTWFMKAGDTLPAITGTLVDQTGNTVNLTGAAVTFIMTNAFFGNAVNAPATITNATAGQVSYSWGSTDTINTGLFDYQWYVVFSSGAQESFPQGYYGKVQIDPQLSSGFEGLLQGNPLFNTLHSSASAPTSIQGNNGDYWYDTTNFFFYGPKLAGAWPSGYSINPSGLSLSTFAVPTSNLNMGGFGFTNLGTTVSGTFTTLNATTLTAATLSLNTLNLSPSSTSSVPLICNIPSGGTADVADFELNGSKAWWINSSGTLNGAWPLTVSPTSTGVVPLTANVPSGSSQNITNFNAVGVTVASVSSAGIVAGTALSATGLTGAVTASRIAGATSGGPPTTGTFGTGDIVYDTTYCCQWLCVTGGSPGTWRLMGTAIISNQQLGAAAASVRLPATGSIPSYFNHLQLIYKAQSAYTTSFPDYVNLQFNGDTTAGHYLWEDIDFETGSASPGSGSGSAQFSYSDNSAQSVLLAGVLSTPGVSGGIASSPGSGSMVIPFASDTHFTKQIQSHSSSADGHLQVAEYNFAGSWLSTAAITYITITTSTGSNYKVNSLFELLATG
jgi:hypothetical protein